MPQRFDPDDPREWLNRARSNLARAKARVADTYLEDNCFDAQQAAEKAVKAVLLLLRIDFPYIHDLAKLLGLLARHGEEVPESVQEAKRLTPYAWMTRYPGSSESVIEEEYRQAVSVAETVVHWAEARVLAAGVSG